jgi:hypothetical protein
MGQKVRWVDLGTREIAVLEDDPFSWSRVCIGVGLGVLLLAFTAAAWATGGAPEGYTYKADTYATYSCTPGAPLWYDFNYLAGGVSEGVCPSGGSVACGYNGVIDPPMNGQSVPKDVGSGMCYEGPPEEEEEPEACPANTVCPEDALALSWMVVACWAAAFCVKFIVRGLS